MAYFAPVCGTVNAAPKMHPSQKSRDRQLTTELLNLYRRLPWLVEENRGEAVQELLGHCNTDQKFLIVDLLKRFRFVDESEYRGLLRQIVTAVQQKVGFTQDNTQIVALTADDEADSAQSMLQALKKEFAASGWDHPKTANKIGKAAKNLAKYPNIILVDEFVGSGKTLESRIKWLESACQQAVESGKAPLGYSIFVYVVAAMEKGITRLADASVPVTHLISLRKGISDHYTGKSLRKARKWMVRLEETLERNVRGKRLPHFGYSHSESLYGTNSNAPNNLFPIFWWPFLFGMIQRKTLFHRAESVPE